MKNEQSYQTYLVGGAVRDTLLNLPVYDQDWVVVGASVDALLSKGYLQVGKDFPVFLHPKTKEEYALARMERKSGQGYHGFSVNFDASVTLEEDLIRRDLTINAMAQEGDGHIIDPYKGLIDLENRILRHVSDAFGEDPLRVLRVARFAAKLAPIGFCIADETLALMKQMTESGELTTLTPERVWQEVVKALNTQTPSVFFNVLNSVGAIDCLFPQLSALVGVEQPLVHHPEGDVWNHAMMVLDASVILSDDVDVRLAALVHDLGKGITPKALWPKHYGHEQAGVPLTQAFCKKYKLPNKTRLLAEKVTQWHGLIHQALDEDGQMKLKPKTYLKILLACQGFKRDGFFEKLLLACEADSKGRKGFEIRDYPQAAVWLTLAVEAAKVDNKHIVKQGFQGKEIAVEIEKVRLRLIANVIKNHNLNLINKLNQA